MKVNLLELESMKCIPVATSKGYRYLFELNSEEQRMLERYGARQVSDKLEMDVVICVDGKVLAVPLKVFEEMEIDDVASAIAETGRICRKEYDDAMVFYDCGDVIIE